MKVNKSKPGNRRLLSELVYSLFSVLRGNLDVHITLGELEHAQPFPLGDQGETKLNCNGEYYHGNIKVAYQ